MSERPGNWQNILWREWRCARDKDYRRHLKDLVSRQPIGWGNLLFALLVSGSLYAAVISANASILWAAEDSAVLETFVQFWTEPEVAFWWCAGGAVAFVPRLVFAFFRQLTRERSAQMAIAEWVVAPGWSLAMFVFVFLLVRCLGGWDDVEAVHYFRCLAIIGSIGVVVGWFAVLESFPNKPRHPARQHGPRPWWSPILWCSSRPAAAQVKYALRASLETRFDGREEWADLVERLNAGEVESDSTDALIERLGHDDWHERVVASHRLVRQGGQVCYRLRNLAGTKEILVREWVVWILRQVSRQTTREVHPRMPSLLCPEHLVHPSAHRTRSGARWLPPWYGCRACGRSRDLLSSPRDLVAVLDADMSDPSIEQDSELRINWLARGSLFDFDRVEIVDATDEDVERFVTQVDNDTDPYRRSRYRRVRCTVAADCRLSENSLRNLRDLLGRVRVRK